jgi:hypothetical protein
MITSGFCDNVTGFLDAVDDTNIKAVAGVTVGEFVQRLKQVGRGRD